MAKEIRQPNSEEHRKIICLQQNGATRRDAFKAIMGFDAAELGKKEAEDIAKDAEVQAKAAEDIANAAKADADKKRKAVPTTKPPAKKATKPPAKKATKDEENWD